MPMAGKKGRMAPRTTTADPMASRQPVNLTLAMPTCPAVWSRWTWWPVLFPPFPAALDPLFCSLLRSPLSLPLFPFLAFLGSWLVCIHKCVSSGVTTASIEMLVDGVCISNGNSTYALSCEKKLWNIRVSPDCDRILLGWASWILSLASVEVYL